MAREAWTDERLDDLVKQVGRGFDETKVEIRDLRAHTGKGFEGVRGEINDLRAEMNARLDAMQRTMILGFASIVASIAGSVIAGLVATQL